VSSTSAMSATSGGLGTVGWREWVGLPELTPVRVKAKVDTGALTSALHAWDIELHERDGVPVATFEVHPRQRSARDAVRVTAPLVDTREVRSSDGRVEERPTVRTLVRIGDHAFHADLTLTSRDAMGFRMLLGRRALQGRYLVDPGASYLASGRSRPPTPTD